jgi:two-component system sensor histidine kinase VicK
MVSDELKTTLKSLTALPQVLNQKMKTNADANVPSALESQYPGKINIEKQQFNIDEGIREETDEARLTVSSHIVNFEPFNSVPVFADRDKIGSVISNLLSNVIKYSNIIKYIRAITALISNKYLQA